jgi:hypothetical protein
MLSPSQLRETRLEERETITLESKEVFFTTYREDLNESDTLVVIQAFFHTWSRPNYFSLAGVGKMYSEGIVASTNGSIRVATHEKLLAYR